MIGMVSFRYLICVVSRVWSSKFQTHRLLYKMKEIQVRVTAMRIANHLVLVENELMVVVSLRHTT